MKIGYLMQAGVPDIRRRPLSGPANHIYHVVRALNNLGHQVRLLAYLDGQIWKSNNLEAYDAVSVRCLDRGPLRLFEKAVRRVQSQLQLPYAALFDSLRFGRACCQELAGFDLLYERMGWVGYGGSLAARWLNIPLILEVNGDHLSEMEMLGVAPHGAQRRLSIAAMNQAVRSASYVVATGDGWRQRFIERWQTPPDKVTVIENGSEIVNLLARDQLRSFETQRSPSETLTIIYIGGFEPWHGIPILIRAVAQAIAFGVPLQLVLVGAGTQQNSIELLVREQGLTEYVTLTGHLAARQFAAHLAEADIGVSPYCGRVEYSGLKLLDYKAAGLATIASGRNGQPAVIEHGRSGLIVPPCDEDALCKAFIELAHNVSLRHKMGRQARQEAESYHSWRHTAEQLEDLFGRVIGL